MPILATPPTVVVPRVTYPVDSRALEFEALDGSDLIEWNSDDFIARSALTGVDLPPRSVVREQVQGLPGSRLVEIYDLEREVFVPVWTKALDRDYRTSIAQQTRVRRMLDYRQVDYLAEEGHFDLVATSQDSGRRKLRVTYLDGLTGDYNGDVTSTTWRIFGLQLLAVDPYWRGEEWSTPTVALPTAMPFLSNSPADAFPRAIAASVALGANMLVQVGGNVESPAVIDLTGPAATTHITSPQGLDVTIGALTAGQQFHLDTGRIKACTLDGVDAWGLLGDSPQWEPLPAGAATMSVQVTGATTATRARVHGTSLWETAWDLR